MLLARGRPTNPARDLFSPRPTNFLLLACGRVMPEACALQRPRTARTALICCGVTVGGNSRRSPVRSVITTVSLR